MTTLKIYLNKVRFFKLIFFSLTAITLGISLSYYLYLENQFSIKLILVLLFAIPFLFYFLFINLKKIIFNKPALILDSLGIQDNVNFFEFGIVPWSVISDVGMIKSNFSHFIIVYLNNNENFTNRLNGFYKRIAKLNSKTYGSPFIIDANNLKIDKAELLKIIKNNIKRI